MKKGNYNTDKFLDLIRTVHKLTAYNIQPFTHKNSQHIRFSVVSPSNVLRRLYKENAIKRLKLYPHLLKEKLQIKNIFYARKGFAQDYVARREIEHESAVADVLVAFYYLYPDYKMEVKLQPKLPLKNGYKYKPDAHIKLYGIDKTFEFLLELERTRGKADIFNKIKSKCEIIDYKKANLNSATQILFVWTSEVYDVFVRPMDYHNYAEVIKPIENRFSHLVKDCQKLDPKKYRFLPLHHFRYLDQPIWLNSRREKIKLI